MLYKGRGRPLEELSPLAAGRCFLVDVVQST